MDSIPLRAGTNLIKEETVSEEEKMDYYWCSID